MKHRFSHRFVLCLWLMLCVVANGVLCSVPAWAQTSPAPALPALSDAALVTEVQKRACLFFTEKADPITGLANDRARNNGKDDYTVASMTATGYALAALPIAVENGWMARAEAQQRAVRTLDFLATTMPHEHGWFYHFVDKRSGERVWNSEVSSIDTALLLAGALVCGEYFEGEALKLADQLYERIDWQWMLTNGGEKPDKKVLSHGWKPESGFIGYDYGAYSEAILLYLLGLGAVPGLPAESWAAIQRDVVTYEGLEALHGGPIFIHQMPQGFYNFKGQRDGLGYDYWTSSLHATRINRLFCMNLAAQRRTYGPQVWGLNASDGPDGYMAYGAPQGPEDGTVSPTGALASLTFTPELSIAAARTMYQKYGDRLWGRYGFGNAFNVDRDWFDDDVIGIDLGMVMIAIENDRSGLVWKLMARHPATTRAMTAIGLKPAGD